VPAWAVIELDTTPPNVTWRAVTVLDGALTVVYEWAGAPEPITAEVTDPAGVSWPMDVSEPGLLRYVLPGGAREGVWSVAVFDDVLNPRVYSNIVLRQPSGLRARSDDELDVRGRAAPGLDVRGRASLVLDMKATRRG
jgi:hypothetical protein